MYVGLHTKYPLLLPDFNETRISSTDFRKIFKYQISLNSVQRKPSCLMQRDGRTDGERQTDRPTGTTQLMVAFRNFTNEPKNGLTQTCKTEDRRNSSPVANFPPQIPHGRYCPDY